MANCTLIMHHRLAIGSLFLLSFFLRLIPLFMGQAIPPGYVDPPSHMGMALDISEGDFTAILHPWWHVKNHYLVDGFDVVDRNSASFFYPPLIDFALAFSYLFIHPGIATYLVISFLYALSIPAIYLLMRSYRLPFSSAIIGASVVALSPALFYSQNYGFWTFAIATNFLLLSWVYLRMNSQFHFRLAILFALFAVLTHWTFLALVWVIAGIECIGNNLRAINYWFFSSIITFPFYLAVFLINPPWNYTTTHFQSFFWINPVFVVIALISVVMYGKKYPSVSAWLIGSFGASVLYYGLHLRIPFGDMIQFWYAYLLAFFVGVIIHSARNSIVRRLLVGIILVSLVYNFSSIVSLGKDVNLSISLKTFDQLNALRGSFDTVGSVLLIDRSIPSWWVTIVAGRTPFVYPDEYSKEDMGAYVQSYMLPSVSSLPKNVVLITEENGYVTLKKIENIPDNWIFPTS